MKICRARPQLVFTFEDRFSSTGSAAQQSVRYIIFRLQASYLSATSHTGRKSCRVKSLYMKLFCLYPSPSFFLSFSCPLLLHFYFILGVSFSVNLILLPFLLSFLLFPWFCHRTVSFSYISFFFIFFLGPFFFCNLLYSCLFLPL